MSILIVAHYAVFGSCPWRGLLFSEERKRGMGLGGEGRLGAETGGKGRQEKLQL